MSLLEQLQQHINQSLREGDRHKLSTLRMLMAAIKQKEIDTRIEITVTDILSIIEKQVQQRFEAAEIYEKAGRNELFDKEMTEAEILKAYLPEKLSEEEVRLMISNIIDETGANTLKDMGAVMAKLKEHADGKIDMKSASQIVKESLS